MHIVSTYCICTWHVHKIHAKSAKRPKVAIPGKDHFKLFIIYGDANPGKKTRRVWLVAGICLAFLYHMFAMPVFTQALQEKMDGLDDRFLSCLEKGKGIYISWLLSYLQDWTWIPMVVWMNRALAPFLPCCMESTENSWFARHIPCHMYTRTCHTSEENHYFGYPASIPSFCCLPIPSTNNTPNSGVNQDLEKLQSLVTVTRFFWKTKGCVLFDTSLHFMAWKAACG